MTDVIKGISGENRFLVMTEQDARQIMSSAPNLNFYRCQQMGEFDAVLDSISAQPKIELCHKLQIGLSTYDSFLIEQFKADILHMYFTGTSHYTASSNKLAESSDNTFYLVPAIYGLEYSGVNFINLTSNPEASKQYIDRFDLDEMKVEQLVYNFYANAGSMYKNGAPMFSLPKHYENHLVELLIGGDAIIIEKSKSLFAPFVEIFSSAVAVGWALQSNKIDATCQSFKVFAIRCAHFPKKRKFQLDVLNTGPNFNESKYVLQVVAQTDKPEKVSIEYEKESCTNGNKDCPTIIIDGGEYTNQKTTTTPFYLSAKPYKKKIDLSFFDFLQTYLIPDMRDLEPEIYRIKTSGCSDVDNYNAEVHCYPMFSWEAKAEFGYVVDKENRADIKTGLVFEGEALFQRDDKSYKYDTESESNKTSAFSTLQDALSGLFDKIDKMNASVKNGHDTKLVKLTVLYPKLTLDGKLELQELQESGEVGMAGDLAISMAPLIGFKGEVDLIEWIIMSCSGPLATAIIKARDLAAGEGNDDQKFKASIYLNLKPTGKISSDFKWAKGIDDSWLSIEGEKSGEAKAEIAFELEGGAKAEGDIYWVKVEAGADIGVTGSDGGGVGITATLTAAIAEDKPALAGQLQFSGMKITYSCFVKVSVKKADTDAESGFGGAIKEKVNDLTKEVKKEGELPVFEVVTWPAEAKPTPINQGHI
jgi:hypothetical protein